MLDACEGPCYAPALYECLQRFCVLDTFLIGDVLSLVRAVPLPVRVDRLNRDDLE